MGTGKIGFTIIKCLSGFGCRIIANDVYENDAVRAYAEYVDLDTLYRESDIITIHTPLLPETTGMIVGTLLAVFFVPTFFVVVRSIFKGSKRQQERFAAHAAEAGFTAESVDSILAEAEEGMSAEERAALHRGAHEIGHTPKEGA